MHSVALLQDLALAPPDAGASASVRGTVAGIRRSHARRRLELGD